MRHRKVKQLAWGQQRHILSLSLPPSFPLVKRNQCQSRSYGIVIIACPGLDRQCLFPSSKGEDSQIIPSWMYKTIASLCFKIKRLFMFYHFYRLLKQRQETIIREISLRSNWVTFSGRSKLICFCRQVAMAYTKVCTDSLFLLMKGHRWFKGRGCGESGETKWAGCAHNTCWPLPFSEPSLPPGIQADNSGQLSILCQARAQVSPQIYIMSETFFSSFKSSECSASPNS